MVGGLMQCFQLAGGFFASTSAPLTWCGNSARWQCKCLFGVELTDDDPHSRNELDSGLGSVGAAKLAYLFVRFANTVSNQLRDLHGIERGTLEQLVADDPKR